MANATQRKMRRGTTNEHTTFIGALAEITVDTTKKTVVVHDGITAGGTPLAKENHGHDITQLTGLGTSATLNVGVSANNIVQLDANAKLPALDGSALYGLAYAPISHQHSIVNIVGLGSAATYDVGVAPQNVVALDVNGLLPTLDASNLINVPVSTHQHDIAQINGLGDVVTYNVGVFSNNIVQLDANAKLPAVDASQLLNVPVTPHLHTANQISNLGTASMLNAGLNPFNVVQLDANGYLPPIDARNLINVQIFDHTHTIEDIIDEVTGIGLNVGTSPSNIVQLDANAKLPVVDGSQLTNIIADKLYSPSGKVYYVNDLNAVIDEGQEVAVVAKTMVVDNINNVAKLPKNISDPVIAEEGDIYWNSTSKAMRIYNGTEWLSLSMI